MNWVKKNLVNTTTTAIIIFIVLLSMQILRILIACHCRALQNVLTDCDGE